MQAPTQPSSGQRTCGSTRVAAQEAQGSQRVAPSATTGALPHATGRRTKRLASVDALRGIASLAVCLYHFTNGNETFLPDGWLKRSGSFGWLGVEVFFVISGFIIPYSLFKGGYHVRRYIRFVVKRVVRLDPPYLATIGLAVLLGYIAETVPGFAGPRFHVTARQLLLHLAYLNVFFGQTWLNPVFWTLAIEFQYYLLIGLLFPLCAHKNPWLRNTLLAALIVSGAALPMHAFLFHWLSLFALGIVAFQYEAGLIARRTFALTLCCCALCCCYLLGPLMAAVGVAAALVIALLRLRSRLLSLLGTISYSLYLIHVPVGGKLVNLGARYATCMPAKLLVLGVALGCSLAAAAVLYWSVEKPAQKWSASVTYGRQPS
jgi:peptidoglycan/LPS O-acetylase OafA/YrhL